MTELGMGRGAAVAFMGLALAAASGCGGSVTENSGGGVHAARLRARLAELEGR